MHGLLDDPLGVLREHRGERGQLVVPHVAGVREVGLLFGLAARHANLRRVDDDDEVAGVEVRAEDGLVLAADDLGHFGGEPPEDHAIRVDDEPLVFDVAFAGGVRGH